jgi:hypothetical protein
VGEPFVGRAIRFREASQMGRGTELQTLRSISDATNPTISRMILFICFRRRPQIPTFCVEEILRVQKVSPWLDFIQKVTYMASGRSNPLAVTHPHEHVKKFGFSNFSLILSLPLITLSVLFKKSNFLFKKYCQFLTVVSSSYCISEL